jgi:transketolase
LEGLDYRSFVVLGDGECNEGSIWEAALAAAKHRLDNLVVLVDFNKYMSFGPTSEVCNMEPFADKWAAFGFAAREVNMVTDPLALRTLLQSLPLEPGKPTAVVCHTIKGQGVSFMENDLSWHHRSKIKDEDIQTIVDHLERAHA